MKFEGGFQGRANKLVDGCYSFWVGGVSAAPVSVVNAYVWFIARAVCRCAVLPLCLVLHRLLHKQQARYASNFARIAYQTLKMVYVRVIGVCAESL